MEINTAECNCTQSHPHPKGGNFYYREKGCEHRPYVKTTSYEPAPDRDDILICRVCGKERFVWSQLDEAKFRAELEA